MAPVGDWVLGIELARWGELENGTPALEVILNAETQEGATLDLWLVTPEETVARWQGGVTDTFVGVTCFQLSLVDLEDKSVVMQLEPGQTYSLVADLRMDSQLLAADRFDVTHFVPELHGQPPGPDSMVFRDLLGCRRAGK
jgi:hypothetical protein